MLDIVVLAAGKGTRMKSSLPKVLHHLAGRPLLQHVLDTAHQLGSDSIQVVVGHGAEQVEAQLAAADVRYVLQAEQLGTGHAVAQAADQLRDEAVVLILYGDVPLIGRETLERLLSQVTEHSMSLLTVNLNDPNGYGRILRNHRGDVLEIVEQKDADHEQLSITEVNTGVMALKGDQLKRWLPQLSNDNGQREYYLTDIIALANRNGVQVLAEQPASEIEVLGINNRQQLAELERYYQEHLAEALMLEGVTLLDPMRFDCRGTLITGQDVVIDINCVFEGEVNLGNNVHIGPNCHLKNITIGDNTIIRPNSVLEDSVVGADCDVGPFARLRPSARLERGAKIGNFVEVKKSTIGEGSKVNHLSYIGDTEIGVRANIGAGTITCNYDGVNKFKTEIGDGAFVGSNTSLVAPVNIGKGATVGAGSTVTKDVADDELTIARGKQRNITGWKKPEKKS